MHRTVLGRRWQTERVALAAAASIAALCPTARRAGRGAEGGTVGVRDRYRANFPGVRVECGPVATTSTRVPDADVILGGPPCQPFSDAGENEGEADDRDCIPDFCAAVERKSRPRQFLMENVRGLLKEKHLPYFGRACWSGSNRRATSWSGGCSMR
jgi:hypothetical protein